MKNMYSLALLAIMITLIAFGSLSLYYGYLKVGLPCFIIGILMTQGFRELSPGNPREIGLLTVFGKRTNIEVEGIILLLKLPIIGDIIGVIEFSMQTEEMLFKVASIRCHDGVRVTGEISVSVKPDPKNLGLFDDAKRMSGIKNMIDEILVTNLAAIAEEPGITYQWIETHGNEVATKLITAIHNMGANTPSTNITRTPVSIDGLGVIIVKVQVKLTPISTKIIEADERSKLEILERSGQALDTETVNQRALARFRMYQEKDPNSKRNLAQCRDEIIYEDLVTDGKVEIVGGGKNLNITDKGNNKGGKTP